MEYLKTGQLDWYPHLKLLLMKVAVNFELWLPHDLLSDLILQTWHIKGFLKQKSETNILIYTMKLDFVFFDWGNATFNNI